MAIKFVDLKAQNDEIQALVDRNCAEIHDRTSYVGGPQVAEFESEFASFLGVGRVVTVASGTDALRLALIAIGVRPGDSVVTTPMTFIATVAAIVQAGARPVFVDVDPETGNITAETVAKYLEGNQQRAGGKARAIVPVDLYGLPAGMDKLRTVAEQFDVRLLEDACQAHGARLKIDDKWVRAGGEVPDAGCFSFYPAKNLGAWGDGGAVATNSDELADQIALLRDHGRTSHYEHSIIGYNSRLDSLQAAVLSAKLARLADWNRRRRQIAAAYYELLSGTGLDLPSEPSTTESCYHLYVVHTRQRDEVRQALAAENIGCGIHYPVPLHLQPACRFLGYRKNDMPVAERLADTALSLPMHPHLRDEEIEQVARVVRRVLN